MNRTLSLQRVAAISIACLTVAMATSEAFSVPREEELPSNLEGGLVLHLELDEGTGTAVADSSGNGNHGVLAGGASWTTGWLGGGIELDGVDGRIEIPDSPSLDITGNLTLAAWIKIDEWQDRDGVITKGTNQTPYSMQVWGQRRLRFAANAGDPPGASGSGGWLAAVRMGIGTWHHVAVTYDGGNVHFYVDGVWDLSDPTPTLTFGVVDEPLTIGADLFHARYLDGVVDDVRIYDRVLSESEIFALAENVPFSSSDLPIIVIDTEGQLIPDDPKIDCFMGIIDNGPAIPNTLGDPFNDYEGRIGIEVRGSSSQGFVKKSFGFETRLPNGENLNVSLLGLPVENDWILYGPYTDKALIRNVLTYDIVRDLDVYAARTRFAELVVNGNYRGVYVLMEKLKQDNDRIDIEPLEPWFVNGDSLTGGYVVKIDRAGESDPGGWDSPFGTGIHYEFADPEPSELSQEQKDYIEGHITAWEAVLDGPLALDPLEGYRDWVDLDSFALYFLINELSKNVDGYILSHYLYKDRDSVDPRIIAGPVWDFNLSYGNADYRDGWQTEGWQLEVPAGNSMPFWWFKLYDDPVFVNRTACMWNELRTHVLDTDSLHTRIDGLMAAIGDSAISRNAVRWPVLGGYLWPNWFIGTTTAEEVDFMKTWLADRATWMDGQLDPLCVQTLWADADTTVTSGLPADSTAFGIATWVVDTAADSVTFITAEDSLTIEAVADTLILSAPQAGAYEFRALAWSGGDMVDVSPYYTYWAFEPDSVAINEINYNSEPSFDPEDWVELVNYGALPIDLSGWVFRDADDLHAFTFPAGTVLTPGKLIVACRDTMLFTSVFPDVVNFVGDLGFGFDGAGETLRLFDSSGLLRDHVPYDDDVPWPTEPDGNGPSLALIDPTLDNALPSSWEASAGHGTPGIPNSSPAGIAAGPSQPALRLRLGDAVPNPFNPTTRLPFTIPARQHARIDVYDVNGRHIARLLDATVDPGEYELVWNAASRASGVYYVQLRSGDHHLSRRIVLLR